MSSPRHSSKETVAVGRRAVLHNLQNRPELNGHLVIIEKDIAATSSPSTSSDTAASNCHEFCVRLLGSKTKDLSPSSSRMNIKESNLRVIPDSAFVTTINYEGKDLVVPLTCLADRDGLGQVGLHLMYSDFLGLEAVIPALKALYGDHQCDDWTDPSEVAEVMEKVGTFGVVTTPIHDEMARANLKDDEVLIVQEKQGQIYEDMINFELVKPLKKTASVGYYGNVPLCKILFPFNADWRSEGPGALALGFQ
jgi:hypothetical protein